MRGREKVISFVLIVCLLSVGLFWGLSQEKSYVFSEMPERINNLTTNLEDKKININPKVPLTVTEDIPGKTNYENEELYLSEEFSTNLPLIIIDTNSIKPLESSVWNDEKRYFVSIEDPYVDGTIKIIDNKNASNTLNEEADLETLCRIKTRGNSSVVYDKKQYQIKLVNEKNENVKKNLLGMGKENEWILNISFVDKSLLRNFLAYSVAKEIMPYTPDVRFCEVIWKEGEKYCYKGVYMLMESIKDGKNRVNLPEVYDNSKFTPALIRRDRYNPNGVMIENYATKNELSLGCLEIKYPDKDKITEKQINNITQQIDRFEEKLYSATWKEFVKYREYVDMDSFVDYFILNEFFLNYDAGYHSTYCYMQNDGKISMGPVWDFDQAIDNSYRRVANLYTTAFHSAPWFDKMLQDPVFTKKIIERYTELRKKILSDKAIESYIEEAICYLGEAIDRDWSRWGYYYLDEKYMLVQEAVYGTRNTCNHEAEVERILYILSEHGNWLDENIDSLYQYKMISLEDAEGEEKEKIQEKRKEYKEIFAVVFVIILLTSVNLVLKYEDE